MKDRMTVFASAFSPMLQYVAKQGVELKRLFATADLNYSTFQAPNSRFTIEQSDHITQQAVLLTRCENLGLLSGQFIVPGNWNIVGYLMMNCHSLGEAFKKYCTYERVVSEGNKTEIRIEDDLAVLDLQLVADTDVTIKQHSENIISCFVTFMRILTGRDIQLKEVRFIHEAPRDTSDYQRIFRAPLVFKQPTSALLLEKKYLDLPIIQPNQQLLVLFEEHAKELLRQIGEQHFYSEKVKTLLKATFPSELPDVTTVAKKLGMSPRNLQLKLKAEGSSFQTLLDEIRKDIAKKYLKNKEVSVADVAYIIGFSEPSAFCRAFKRWTGISPKEYRAFQ